MPHRNSLKSGGKIESAFRRSPLGGGGDSTCQNSGLSLHLPQFRTGCTNFGNSWHQHHKPTSFSPLVCVRFSQRLTVSQGDQILSSFLHQYYLQILLYIFFVSQKKYCTYFEFFCIHSFEISDQCRAG